MAALTSNELARMTARVNAFRLGTTRLGVVLKDKELDDVANDGRYIWTQTEGPPTLAPSTTWTTTES